MGDSYQTTNNLAIYGTLILRQILCCVNPTFELPINIFDSRLCNERCPTLILFAILVSFVNLQKWLNFQICSATFRGAMLGTENVSDEPCSFRFIV